MQNTADSLIMVQPDDFDNYYWKAYAYEKMGKDLYAMSTLKIALQESNNTQRAKYALADIYYNMGMYNEASPLLDELLNETASDFSLIKKRVGIYEYYKQNRDAITLLEKNISSDSLNLYSLTHLGDNYLKIGRDSIARSYYEKAFEINTNDMLIANKLASVYLRTNADLAKIHCESVLKRDSTNVQILQKAATACLKLEKEEEALLYYQRAIAVGDSSLNSLKNVGMLLQKEMRFHESREILKKAYQRDTTNLNVVYYLAMATSIHPIRKRLCDFWES